MAFCHWVQEIICFQKMYNTKIKRLKTNSAFLNKRNLNKVCLFYCYLEIVSLLRCVLFVNLFSNDIIYIYSRDTQNWPFFKTADFSINNAINPTNLGAKWKLLLSRFGKCPWVKDLTQYWLSYGLEKAQNLNLENAQNESVFVKFFCCSWLCSVNQIIK